MFMRMIIVFILFLLLPASLVGQDISSGLKNNTNPPGEGDVFYLKTFKPFTSDDKYILDMAPLSGIDKGHPDGPNSFNLFQNYPNPFNSTTNIQFNIAKPSKTPGAIIAARKLKA